MEGLFARAREEDDGSVDSVLTALLESFPHRRRLPLSKVTAQTSSLCVCACASVCFICLLNSKHQSFLLLQPQSEGCKLDAAGPEQLPRLASPTDSGIERLCWGRRWVGAPLFSLASARGRHVCCYVKNKKNWRTCQKYLHSRTSWTENHFFILFCLFFFKQHPAAGKPKYLQGLNKPEQGAGLCVRLLCSDQRWRCLRFLATFLTQVFNLS